LFGVFISLGFVSATCSNNTYSGSGNWTIDSTNSPNVCSDMEITLNGAFSINNGGNLTFRNVTFLVNYSAYKEYSLNVWGGGWFYVYDSNLSGLNKGYELVIAGNLSMNNSNMMSGELNLSGHPLLFAYPGSSVVINNSYIGVGNTTWNFRAGSNNVYVENSVLDGGSYALRTTAKIDFRNVSFGNDRMYLFGGGHLRCVDCSFDHTQVSSTGVYSYYSKNHNHLQNQTLVKGEFNYSSDLADVYLSESNKSIIFKSTTTSLTVDSGINVTFDNVTLTAGAVFVNENNFILNGNLIINRTNMTVLDIGIVNKENIITNSFHFFQNFYLDVKAIYQGVVQENVNVTGYDGDESEVFTNTTDATGYITRQTLTTFLVNDSGVTSYNNFTINSSEIGGKNRSEIINLTSSTLITIPHDYCDFSSTGWSINDENKICENRTINISTGDITISDGFSLTIYNSTINFGSSEAQNINIGNNATFIFNKSSLAVGRNYVGRIYGSPNSTITYLDSFFHRYIYQEIYIKNDSLIMQNTTLGKLSGYFYTTPAVGCQLTFKMEDISYNEVVINRSRIFQNICSTSDVVGGNSQVILLDTEYISHVGFTTNSENSSVIIKNTLDLKVFNDSLIAVASTLVNITDENGNSVYNGITDANGEISSISLTHRIFNNSGMFSKNYTLFSNGKTFDLIMGMPRREYSNRRVIIGTYNQNYEEKLSRVPYLYDFGYTIHDDTDKYDYRNGNATYQGIYNAGFSTSVSTWAWNSSSTWNKVGYVDNESHREWLVNLKNKGFELVLHSPTGDSDVRGNMIAALNNWSLYFGFPMMYIEHGTSNTEHLVTGTGAVASSDYYLLDLVNTSNISYYHNLDYAPDNGAYKTVRENSSSGYRGWKVYGESIDPITGERWSNGEISLFPNYTNPKALLHSVNQDGVEINLTSMIGKIHIRDESHKADTGMLPVYTSTHIFDLQETHDLTIMFTHSESFPEFNYTLTEIARYDGYFVPAGILLNYSSKLERVAITGGDKTFTVTNNGDFTIEGVVVYPDTNGTIINISYANISDGRYLLSIGLDKDEMMLPSLASGESLIVTYDIMGAYSSSIPKITEITNSHVELRNAIYNSTAKKTEFKVGLDRITTYNTTNSTPRSTNMTINNLDASKTYTILRDDSAWTNYSWSGNTLTIWTFLSEHNFTIQEKQVSGSTCTYASSCLGGYCVHGYCRSSSIYCGDGYCDTGETCSSCPADCGVCSTSSGGVTFKPTQEQLEEGYSKLLRKTQKVQFTINNQTHTVVVNSVSNENKTVEIELEELGELIELSENETKKFDLNDDGYYDLQIWVKEVRSNGYANLEFKEIHEKVPAEEKEEQESLSKKEGIKSWIWVVGGVISILIIGIVIRQLLKKRFFGV